MAKSILSRQPGGTEWEKEAGGGREERRVGEEKGGGLKAYIHVYI